MIINKFNQTILDTQDIIDGLYSGKIVDLSTINTIDIDVVNAFNSAVSVNCDQINKMRIFCEPTINNDEYTKSLTSTWLIPDEYLNFDIVNWLNTQCTTQAQLDRVTLELNLFTKFQMIPILRSLKYLVDFMRANDIVWGVGRGSSIASYCLYLIGIHKIDSIKYNIPIEEFLKGE